MDEMFIFFKIVTLTFNTSFPLIEALLKLFFWYAFKLTQDISFNVLHILILVINFKFSLGKKKKLQEAKINEHKRCSTCIILSFFKNILIQKVSRLAS